jgi:glycosyltransferase involved in cell wall biosynthesis
MTTPPSPSRQPILILNQYYAPDIASTGHLLDELARDLAKQGFPVRVISCRPSYGPPSTWVPCPLREKTDGVEIHRMVTTRYSKDRMVGRAINIFTFFFPLFFRMLFASRRDDVHLYTTNPPFLGVIGATVSLFRRHRYVQLLHDAHPQVGVWVKKIKAGGFIDRAWNLVNKFIYRRAERTIVLCDAAKKLVCETYGIAPDKVHVIHNWADPNLLSPKPKAESDFAKANGLIEPFTVMYSGNIGLYYEFETILEAADRLRNENFRLVLVGGGGRRKWVEAEVKRRNLTNVQMHPYQPFETLSDSMCASDAQLVTIAKGIEGISFPSKLYSSLAVGRPILALSESWSEMRGMVEDNKAGRWSEIGDPDSLVKILREMMADPEGCRQMGINARKTMEAKFTVSVAAKAYGEVLERAGQGR